jgi:hypothetical protein
MLLGNIGVCLKVHMVLYLEYKYFLVLDRNLQCINYVKYARRQLRKLQTVECSKAKCVVVRD